MKIETLEIWNSVLEGCGCCEMPVCPVPLKECESIRVDACEQNLPEHEDVPPEDACKIWKTKTSVQSYSFSGSETSGGFDVTHSLSETQSTTWESRKDESGDCEVVVVACSFSNSENYEKSPEGGGDAVQDWNVVQSSSGDGVSCPGSYSYTDNLDPDSNDSFPIDFCPLVSNTIDNSWNYLSFGNFSKSYVEGEGPFAVSWNLSVSFVELTAEDLLEEIEALNFDDDVNGSECESKLEGIDDCEGGISAMVKARFRWVVPDTWTGSYFKVTWDILNEPTDSETPRSFVSQDNVWTWAGPGSAEDEDSWKSPWYEIDPPEVPGVRKVVNVRFECYKSAKFGVRPQTTGEGVELEAV